MRTTHAFILICSLLASCKGASEAAPAQSSAGAATDDKASPGAGAPTPTDVAESKGRETGPAVRSEPAAPLEGPSPIRPNGPVHVVTANARSPLGYNLDFPGDWSRLMPFIDLMHDARPWTGSCPPNDRGCDQVGHIDLDDHGWPKSLRYRDEPRKSYTLVETPFSTHEHVSDEGKRFVITWEGEGELSFHGIEVLSKDLRRRRITFIFRPGNKFVRIEKTDPKGTGNYIRDIRVFREDNEKLLEQGKIFNPDMLDYLEPFGSLRFMDWMLSNDAEQRDAVWAERPRFDYVPWIRQWIDPKNPKAGTRVGGYPVEVMVALANEVGADPHFNMPYRSTDGWIKGFATYVRDHLAPNLRATIEYSNEVWNWSFPQATYANVEGRKLWPDEGSAWVQYMGMRAAKMCKIWREVFKGQEQRLRCVIAPQTAWIDLAKVSLDCPRWVAMDPKHNRPCHEYADAVAITGYFSGRLGDEHNRRAIRTWLGKGEKYAIERALRQLEYGDVPDIKDAEGRSSPEHSDSLETTIEYFKIFKPIADERKLELYVYEGGTSIGSSDPQLQEFLFKVTEDPRLYKIYMKLFAGFKEAGGTVFNCWGWIGPHDPWSNAQTVTDRARTKYRAIVDFAQRNPCWWDRCDRSRRGK